MASLNTLRTKYGIVLSVVIALVLVAFILGDQLSMRGNGGNVEIENETIMVVNGEEITQQDYAEYRHQYGMQGMDADYMAVLVYNRIVYDKYYKPTYEAAGIGYVEADKEAFLTEAGKAYSNAGYTGEEFDANMAYKWNSVAPIYDMSATNERAYSLYTAGKYTNSLEVENALYRESQQFDGHYVKLPYEAITAAEVTAEEIDAYYEANREKNPLYGTRTLEYAAFPYTTENRVDVESEANTFMEAWSEGTAAQRVTTACEVNRNNGRHMIDTISNTRNVAIWAYNAEVGEKKSWSSHNVYYVAMVTNIDENEYEPKNEAAIKTQLEKEKKFAAAKQTLTMETEGAESGKFADVAATGSTLDAALVNAIVRSKENEQVYVMGADGVYLFTVDNIDGKDEMLAEDREVKRAAMTESEKSMFTYAMQMNPFANLLLIDNVEIEDMRGESEL